MIIPLYPAAGGLESVVHVHGCVSPSAIYNTSLSPAGVIVAGTVINNNIYNTASSLQNDWGWQYMLIFVSPPSTISIKMLSQVGAIVTVIRDTVV